MKSAVTAPAKARCARPCGVKANIVERNQMRDVLFFEVDTDDPVEWVRREICGAEVHITAEEGRPGEMTVFVESAGMYQKFLFTEL